MSDRSYLTPEQAKRQAKRKVRSGRYRRKEPIAGSVNPRFRKRMEREGWERGSGGRLWYPPGKKPRDEFGGGSPYLS